MRGFVAFVASWGIGFCLTGYAVHGNRSFLALGIYFVWLNIHAHGVQAGPRPMKPHHAYFFFGSIVTFCVVLLLIGANQREESVRPCGDVVAVGVVR